MSESVRSYDPSISKVNSLYTSLAKIEQNITTKQKLELLAKSGQRKRVKRFWNAEKDSLLVSLTKMYGLNWDAIAEAFNDPLMTAEIVQERYENRISPEIIKTRFSWQEDQLIAHYYTTLGANWKKITAHLPGRTEVMIRNRFYSSIKKRLLDGTFYQFTGEDLKNLTSNNSFANKINQQPSADEKLFERR